jgi:transposase
LTSHDAPDPDKTSPPKPAKLVFFDSTDIHWCPDVGNCYVSQGGQIRTDSPGKENPWYALFGSLISPSGEGVYTLHDRKRHAAVQAPLETLLASEPDTFFFVILDGASAHTPPKLDTFWEAQRESLCRIPLPTYSPHLNLIERLWRLMRGQMTRDQFYESLKEEAEAIVEWVEKLPFSKFCSVMGIDEAQLIFV